MKYSYEFKLNVVKCYLKIGIYPNVKIESSKETFKRKVRTWAALYKKHGAESLKHKKQKQFDINKKLETIEKFKNGYSTNELAISLGIEHLVVSNWIKRYNAKAINALKEKEMAYIQEVVLYRLPEKYTLFDSDGKVIKEIVFDDAFFYLNHLKEILIYQKNCKKKIVLNRIK